MVVVSRSEVRSWRSVVVEPLRSVLSIGGSAIGLHKTWERAVEVVLSTMYADLAFVVHADVEDLHDVSDETFEVEFSW